MITPQDVNPYNRRLGGFGRDAVSDVGLAKPAETSEYTMNVMHQKSDIENNILEVMKTKLKVYDERLVKLEDIILDKFINENKFCTFVSDFIKFLEAVCLWTMVILLWKKVFN